MRDPWKIAAVGSIATIGVLGGVLWREREHSATLRERIARDSVRTVPRAPPRADGSIMWSPSPAIAGASAVPGPAASAPVPGIDDAEIVVRMKNQFDSDAYDTSGSVPAAHVQAAFSTGRPELQGAHLDAVECRRTLCRLAMRFDDRRTDRRAMTALFGPASDPLVHLGSFVAPGREHSPDGSVKVTVYLARTGNIDLDL